MGQRTAACCAHRAHDAGTRWRWARDGRARGRAQTVQYIQPQHHERLAQAELLVIDEAAAIPLPVVRRLLGPYLIFLCSTVNGRAPFPPAARGRKAPGCHIARVPKLGGVVTRPALLQLLRDAPSLHRACAVGQPSTPLCTTVEAGRALWSSCTWMRQASRCDVKRRPRRHRRSG
jgi:hypothetical protein